MSIKSFFDNRKIILIIPFSFILIFLCVRYSEECYRGIASGIGFCIDVLVPSLFMLMAAASLITRSGTAEYLCAPLSRLSWTVFRLPGVCLAAIALGLVGGYPVGARCASTLYQSGAVTRRQAEKTAYVAVAAGPGFVINYVGMALLNSKSTGALLLAAQTLAVILCGVLIGRSVSCEREPLRIKRKRTGDNLLIEAVRDASSATVSMCAMVMVFSAAVEVAQAILGTGALTDMLCGFMEVTTGCNRMCGDYPLPLIAFFIGFGGLSVHCQIYAVLGDIRVNKGLFFLYRIISGILSAALAYIFVRSFPQSTAVFSSTDAAAEMGISATTWGSAALIGASLCFLMSISGGNYVRNSRMAEQGH